MRKLLLTLLLACISLTYLGAQKAPIVIQVNAGSRAPYGTVQNLLVDASGRCSYNVDDVTGLQVSSSKFNISKVQVDSFLKKANDIGFFKLQPTYSEGYDGSGVFMSLNYAGHKYHVDLINRSVPEITTLLDMLNGFLAPRKVRIDYEQK